MKKFLIPVLALCFAGNASAIDYEPEEGVTIQINAGMTISTLTGIDLGGAKAGGTAGIKFEYMLPSMFGTYVNAGADWTMKGASKSWNESFEGHNGQFPVSNTSTLHYLQIPIHVGFRYNLADNLGIYGEVGPYFSMGINGKNSTTVSADGTWVKEFEGSYNLFSSHDDKPYFQIWDFGFGFRIGAEYENHYSLSIGMDWGITDMFRDKYRDKMADKNIPLDMAHNYNTYITLGYRF